MSFPPFHFVTAVTTILFPPASVIRMKALVLTIIILFLARVGIAQIAPLTQAEYVKMLYSLQAAPGRKAEVIEALRKRGIDFVVTDGVRSLTRTKGANDDELKRALEEAERRRQNPESTKLPSSAESLALIESARSKTLEAVDEMPDFVVKQQIQRSAAYAGTNNFRNLDRLVVAVSYKSSGDESYRVLSVNGLLQNASESRGSYESVGGTSSTGEFVTMLATIFKPESRTRFEIVQTDILRGYSTFVYEFALEKDRARQLITAVGSSASSATSTITGIKGRIWIDRKSGRVLRVESEATEIPASFPVRTAKRSIDYDWVKIADQFYLLPSLSDVRLTMSERAKLYETRNLIRFREYQKYGSEVRVLDDDDKPEPETPIKP